MTSTSTIEVSPRLPPIDGLLENTLDQALRARQRRVFVMDHPGQRLAALRVMDSAIDQAIIAASIYGQEAVNGLEDRISKTEGDARSAAIFLRLALAVQLGDENLGRLIARYAREEPRSTHEALQFYPVPRGPFVDRHEHLVALFAQAKINPDLMPLALRLAGERDLKELVPEIQTYLGHADLSPWAHYALVCLGAADEATQHFVENALYSGDDVLVAVGMRICAIDPRLPSDKALESSLSAPESVAETAWAILACRYSRRVYDYAMSLPDLSIATKMRLVALTGFMDGVVAVCAALAERDGSVTPAEADVLTLALGRLPMEVTCEPNDRAAKSKALRTLVLAVCRKAHITVRNDADVCAWDAKEILADAAQVARVRVRRGKCLSQAVPELDQAVLEVTHGLRQWLYLERAAFGGFAFSLSSSDISRRQELAMMVAEFTDAMHDQ